MPSVDSVYKTNAVCSVPGGVLGAEDAGASKPLPGVASVLLEEAGGGE